MYMMLESFRFSNCGKDCLDNLQLSNFDFCNLDKFNHVFIFVLNELNDVFSLENTFLMTLFLQLIEGKPKISCHAKGQTFCSHERAIQRQ